MSTDLPGPRTAVPSVAGVPAAGARGAPGSAVAGGQGDGARGDLRPERGWGRGGRRASLDDPRARPDLRLVSAALAAWAAVLAALLGGPGLGVSVCAVAAVVLLTLRGRRLPHRTRAAVLAAAGCALAVGLPATVAAWQVRDHPLRAAAERGSSATLRVVLTDDPRPLRGTIPGEDRVLVAADLVAAVSGAGEWRTGGRVLLLAPAEGWLGLLPGQEAVAEGLLAPAQRSDLTIAVLRVRGAPAVVGAEPWWQTAAGGLRDGLRTAAQVLPEPSAGLLPGLAVGDTRHQTAEVEQDFRAAGLTHLTAVSGANLMIIGGAVLGLMRLFRADPRVAAVAAALAVVGFVVLARPSPSVVRAAVMGLIVLLALGLGRGRSAVPALAAAVLVLLLADPALAVDAGFALSVLATAALVLVAPSWAAALHRRGVPLAAAEMLVVPAAACLATAPLVAGLNGQVSLVTVPANLLVVPAVPAATILGVLAAVVSPVSPALAELCAWLSGPAVGWLVLVADRAAAVPGGVVAWPAGLLGALLLTGVLLALVVAFRFRRSRLVILAILVGLAVVLVPTRFVRPGWPPPDWVAVACDVGQGDAFVLATGEPGRAVLVDVGPEDGTVDACLSRLGVTSIALVVLSHLHADHVGGLTGALRGRSTAAVALGPAHEPRAAARRVEADAHEAGAALVELAAGRRLDWPALTLEVLGAPPARGSAGEAETGEDGTAVNNTSLVVRATTPAGRILFTGDVELEAQAELLHSGTDLRADVLKMPHHGSRYTSREFLAAVAPRAVLVSVGAGNSYRHPNPGLMDLLGGAGIAVRRTDLSGDVAVTAADGLVERGDPLPAPRGARTPRDQGRRRPAPDGRRLAARRPVHDPRLGSRRVGYRPPGFRGVDHDARRAGRRSAVLERLAHGLAG